MLPSAYPEMDLSHLRRLTDTTGIIQHALHALPHYRTGYTTDDNARALIAALKAYQYFGNPACLELAGTYLSFLCYAQKPNGKWHNFVGYTRRFLDREGSEDSFGRAVWALGYLAASLPQHYLGTVAQEALDKALPQVDSLSYPRAMAYTLLGLSYYYLAFPSDRLLRRINSMAEWFSNALIREEGPGWCWFEPELTYSNAIMPAGLFMAYRATGRRSYWKTGSRALGFLSELHFVNGYLKLVGNQGWYEKDGIPAAFDEQPEDAGCLSLAYTLAFLLSKEEEYLTLAGRSFDWFLGQNHLGIPLYDPESGGCFDGLTPKGANSNRGAESLLAYLHSRLNLETLDRAVQNQEERAPSYAWLASSRDYWQNPAAVVAPGAVQAEGPDGIAMTLHDRL